MKPSLNTSLFNPRHAGALCDKCPFNKQTSVPPQIVSNPDLFIVAESPGKEEVVKQTPLVGPSGWKLRETLRKVGVNLDRCSKTNTILCRLPKWAKQKDINDAVACCRPRLEKELAANDAPLVSVGDMALLALTGKTSILAWRGHPQETRWGPVFPTIHPAFVLNQPEWEDVFELDLRRQVKGVALTWPMFPTEPDDRLATLRKIIDDKLPIAVDIENTGDPMSAHIRCIGVATSKRAVSVPTEALDPYSDEIAVLRQVLKTPVVKVFHNAQHDLLGLKYAGWEVNGDIRDTMIAHAVCVPQLPHGLSHVASFYLAFSRWKIEFKISGDEDKGLDVFVYSSLKDLCLYNTKDAWVTALLWDILFVQLGKTYKGWELFYEQINLSAVALKMREAGVLTAPEKFIMHKARLEKAKIDLQTQFQELVNENHIVCGKALKTRTHVYIGPYRLGKSGGHTDVKKLLFKRYGQRPIKYGAEGPALDKETLSYYTAAGPQIVKDIARTVLTFRQTAKVLDTYIDGMPIQKDGKIRSNWNTIGAITGRWASSKPNLTNIPKSIRDLLIAAPGKVFVAADFSQLEMRIIAILAGDKKLLEWYAEGKDVHTLTAESVYGRKPSKGERDLVKRLEYGVNYGAQPEKLWHSISPAFPAFTLKAARGFCKQWYLDHPEILDYQERLLSQAALTWHVEERLSGRREYFHDGRVDRNVVLNFPIQGFAGTLINRAILTLDKELNWTDEKILIQCHDELLLEVPIERVAAIKALLKQHMEQSITLGGHTMKFFVDVKVGPNWKEMELC